MSTRREKLERAAGVPEEVPMYGEFDDALRIACFSADATGAEFRVYSTDRRAPFYVTGDRFFAEMDAVPFVRLHQSVTME